MEHEPFDDLSRALVTSGTRRGIVGALVGLLGLGDSGAVAADRKSKQKRRRERRKKRHDRRKHKQTARPIKLTVVNPSANPDPEAIEVELGFGSRGTEDGRCCQGQAGYKLTPGQIQPYSTEKNAAYIWIDNKYFIYFVNPGIGLPHISWAYNGAPEALDPGCCKPRGQVLGDEIGMDIGDSTTLDMFGRLVNVARFQDVSGHKSFHIVL